MENYKLLTKVYTKHLADLERIRNMHEKKLQEIEINRKITQNNYQISSKEIMRLCKLDENKFKITLENLANERRKIDQLHERETKRIINENEAKMKSLHNEEEKINNEYKLATPKLDDDKEINNIRENKRFETKSEERKKELDNQKIENEQKFQLKQQQMDQQFQIQISMINAGILKQYNLMNQNNKNEKPSEENSKCSLLLSYVWNANAYDGNKYESK